MSSSKRRIYLFDTTLRDGAQTQGVDFSVSDKRVIAEALDRLGVDYIEGGWPGANPTDDAFFAESLSLKKAKFVAFGMTRKAYASADNDGGLSSLANSVADSACIVGKAWDRQVELVLDIDLNENLAMIGDSIARLHGAKGEAMFDAEHFFDGYKRNHKYALRCLEVALKAGASWVVLCDTRGGCLPSEVHKIASEVCEQFGGDRVGIHAHNDTENAVANSLAAVEAGVCQVQGTINGLGERCGNANIISLIPNLSLKLGYDIGRCARNIRELSSISRLLDERLGWKPRAQQPYVGRSAFAHKGGLHASAVAKAPRTYEHIAPQRVGNKRSIIMSNQAGLMNVNQHLDKLGITIPNSDLLQSFLGEVKRREHDGFSYDGADASFELLAYKHMKRLPEFFEILRFRVIDERRHNALGELINESEATVYVRVGDKELDPGVAMGNGPVHAFDKALRATLIKVFPSLKPIELIDYKVRIIPPHNHERGTAAVTRVLLESTDGKDRWSTVGVSANIIDASAIALCDSYTYYQFFKKHRKEMRMTLKRERIKKLSEKNKTLSKDIKELSGVFENSLILGAMEKKEHELDENIKKLPQERGTDVRTIKPSSAASESMKKLEKRIKGQTELVKNLKNLFEPYESIRRMFEPNAGMSKILETHRVRSELARKMFEPNAGISKILETQNARSELARKMFEPNADISKILETQNARSEMMRQLFEPKGIEKLLSTERELSSRMKQLSMISDEVKNLSDANKLSEHMKRVSQANEATLKVMKRLSEMEQVYFVGIKELSKAEKIYFGDIQKLAKPNKQVRTAEGQLEKLSELEKICIEKLQKLLEAWEVNQKLTHKIDSMLARSKRLIDRIDEHLANRQVVDRIDEHLANRQVVDRIDEHLANRQVVDKIDKHPAEHQSARDELKNKDIANRIDEFVERHQATDKKSKSTKKND